MSRWKRYTSTELHKELYQKTTFWRNFQATAFEDADGWSAAQALQCPYYVTLEGRLGGDWGVNVNPESPQFGHLIFEHDWCGCPLDDEGRPNHPPVQRTDAWLKPKTK